jgi:hypothetical protein
LASVGERLGVTPGASPTDLRILFTALEEATKCSMCREKIHDQLFDFISKELVPKVQAVLDEVRTNGNSAAPSTERSIGSTQVLSLFVRADVFAYYYINAFQKFGLGQCIECFNTTSINSTLTATIFRTDVSKI